MERLLSKDLISWKNKKNRQPLMLKGARQVGKTWLLTEFGKTMFDDVLYLNLPRLKSWEVQSSLTITRCIVYYFQSHFSTYQLAVL